MTAYLELAHVFLAPILLKPEVDIEAPGKLEVLGRDESLEINRLAPGHGSSLNAGADARVSGLSSPV